MAWVNRCMFTRRVAEWFVVYPMIRNVRGQARRDAAYKLGALKSVTAGATMLNLMKTEEDEMSEEFVILLLRYYPQFHPHLVVEMALYLLTKLQNEWTSAEATQLCLETFFDTWARAGTITNNFVMQKLMFRILVRVRKFLQMTKVSRAQDLQQWQNAVFIAHLCTDVIHSEFIDHQMLTEVRVKWRCFVNWSACLWVSRCPMALVSSRQSSCVSSPVRSTHLGLGEWTRCSESSISRRLGVAECAFECMGRYFAKTPQFRG